MGFSSFLVQSQSSRLRPFRHVGVKLGSVGVTEDGSRPSTNFSRRNKAGVYQSMPQRWAIMPTLRRARAGSFRRYNKSNVPNETGNRRVGQHLSDSVRTLRCLAQTGLVVMIWGRRMPVTVGHHRLVPAYAGEAFRFVFRIVGMDRIA